MRIVKPPTVRQWMRQYASAAAALARWLELAEHAHWRNLHEVRQTMRSADEVVVASGRPVIVFNIGGNKYRLIAAVHYNIGRVYVLRFMTHRDYDKERWKEEL